jgi:hypothetical protein
LEFRDFLNDLPTQTAERAHAMSCRLPRRRGEAERRDYALMLAQDLNDFRDLAEIHGTESILDLLFPVYRKHLRKAKLRHLVAKSRCVAAEVAGAAAVQFQRAERRKAIESQKRREVGTIRRIWRERMLQALNPDTTAIHNASTERGQLIERLEMAKEREKRMQGINLTLRKLDKASHQKRVAAVVAFGIEPGIAELLVMKGDRGVAGFDHYCLINTANEIRRLESRLARMSK